MIAVDKFIYVYGDYATISKRLLLPDRYRYTSDRNDLCGIDICYLIEKTAALLDAYEDGSTEVDGRFYHHNPPDYRVGSDYLYEPRSGRNFTKVLSKDQMNAIIQYIYDYIYYPNRRLVADNYDYFNVEEIVPISNLPTSNHCFIKTKSGGVQTGTELKTMHRLMEAVGANPIMPLQRPSNIQSGDPVRLNFIVKLFNDLNNVNAIARSVGNMRLDAHKELGDGVRFHNLIEHPDNTKEIPTPLNRHYQIPGFGYFMTYYKSDWSTPDILGYHYYYNPPNNTLTLNIRDWSSKGVYDARQYQIWGVFHYSEGEYISWAPDIKEEGALYVNLSQFTGQQTCVVVTGSGIVIKIPCDKQFTDQLCQWCNTSTRPCTAAKSDNDGQEIHFHLMSIWILHTLDTNLFHHQPINQ